MTERNGSLHAEPSEGVTHVPYFVYEDADLYGTERQLIFRGPVWNYLGLEIGDVMPTDGVSIAVSKRPVVLDSSRIDTLLVIPL